MNKPIDMLLAIKKPWLEQMANLFSSLDNDQWRPSNQGLSKFWDLASDAYLRRELEAMRAMLESWVQKYFAAELDTGKLSSDIQPILIPLLSQCEHACMQAASDLYDTEERLRLHNEIVPLFNLFHDLAAGLELGMYMHEIRRREEALRNQVQQLDETRSSFINTAAHELKTPLTLIEGYTQMLSETLQEVDDVPDREILMRGIKTGTTRMREIIDELIDISLVDNQMLSLYYQPVHIHDFLESIAEEFSPEILDKSLEFELEAFSDEANATYADKERLMQAFNHVIRNAIQYTPEGGAITIKGRSLPGFIEVSCHDTGIGIDREDQATIFEKFGRVPSTLARHDTSGGSQNSGSGLGLHLAKGILEAHGGTIWVESPGRDDESCPGSTFHMMIPQRDKAPKAPAVQRFGSISKERFE